MAKSTIPTKEQILKANSRTLGRIVRFAQTTDDPDWLDMALNALYEDDSKYTDILKGHILRNSSLREERVRSHMESGFVDAWANPISMIVLLSEDASQDLLDWQSPLIVCIKNRISVPESLLIYGNGYWQSCKEGFEMAVMLIDMIVSNPDWEKGSMEIAFRAMYQAFLNLDARMDVFQEEAYHIKKKYPGHPNFVLNFFKNVAEQMHKASEEGTPIPLSSGIVRRIDEVFRHCSEWVFDHVATFALTMAATFYYGMHHVRGNDMIGSISNIESSSEFSAMKAGQSAEWDELKEELAHEIRALYPSPLQVLEGVPTAGGSGS